MFTIRAEQVNVLRARYLQDLADRALVLVSNCWSGKVEAADTHTIRSGRWRCAGHRARIRSAVVSERCPGPRYPPFVITSSVSPCYKRPTMSCLAYQIR